MKPTPLEIKAIEAELQVFLANLAELTAERNKLERKVRQLVHQLTDKKKCRRGFLKDGFKAPE